MAVYTHVPAEDLAEFLKRYDVGDLISAKGIAEGVENSNYLVDTDGGRFFLTLYEKRVNVSDLPYFLSLMTFVADSGLPVPRPIADREGRVLQTLQGRTACLIEYLAGISVSEPGPELCFAAGTSLGNFHTATAAFPEVRENALGHEGRMALADVCLPRSGEIDASLPDLIRSEMAFQRENWPASLPRATIHADLFPDNVLAHGNEITGLIDFYFACTDIRAYDLAIMHSAWCFSADGAHFYSDRADALEAGYRAAHALTDDEANAMPILMRAASLRFLLTRCYDWINTPADAMVTRHDPMAYARRLKHYRAD